MASEPAMAGVVVNYLGSVTPGTGKPVLFPGSAPLLRRRGANRVDQPIPDSTLTFTRRGTSVNCAGVRPPVSAYNQWTIGTLGYVPTSVRETITNHVATFHGKPMLLQWHDGVRFYGVIRHTDDYTRTHFRASVTMPGRKPEKESEADSAFRHAARVPLGCDPALHAMMQQIFRAVTMTTAMPSNVLRRATTSADLVAMQESVLANPATGVAARLAQPEYREQAQRLLVSQMTDMYGESLGAATVAQAVDLALDVQLGRATVADYAQLAFAATRLPDTVLECSERAVRKMRAAEYRVTFPPLVSRAEADRRAAAIRANDAHNDLERRRRNRMLLNLRQTIDDARDCVLAVPRVSLGC